MCKLLPLLVFLFLLSACAPTRQPPPLPTARPASPFDGQWKGVGESTDGLPFTVTLTIKSNQLAGVIYSFNDASGLNCTSIEHAVIPPTDRVDIVDSRLSFEYENDIAFNASFSKDDTLSGDIKVHWRNRQPRCNGDYEIRFTAEKQVETIQAGAPKPRPAPMTPLEVFVQLLIFGLSNGSILALNAIGVTVIYSAVRTLNLAHGDVFALATVSVTSLVNAIGITLDWPPIKLAGTLFVVLLVSIGLGALLSVGIDRLAFRPFRGHSRLAPLIATLGLSFVLFQAALVWRAFQPSWIPGEHRSVPGLPEVPTDGIPSFLPEINLAQALGLSAKIIVRFSDVFVVAMALLFVALATWFLRKTSTGRAIRAVSQNRELAQILGVNVNKTLSHAFAIGGAFAGAAAFIFALYYGRPFGSHGAQSGLLAFTAALLGGIGNPGGALLSGMTMGVLSSLSDYYLKAQWTPMFLLAALIALLAWRPMGLAAGGEADESSSRDSVILTATRDRSRVRPLLFVLILFGLSPMFFQTGQSILRIAGVFILLTLSLNLALGVAGVLDLGFAASFGLGAYAAALLGKLDGTIVLLIGGALGASLGIVKGILARRLRGDFFAIATLSLGLLTRLILINWNSLTGGAGGLYGFSPLRFLTFGTDSVMTKFYLVFGFILLATMGSIRLIGSRVGRAWSALSEDESAALASGIDVGRERSRALTVSSAMAGVAGALYAGTLLYVDPETMSFHISAMILTMVILGGAGDVLGAIVGALTIVLYDKVVVGRIADLVALVFPFALGSAPDIRGASFFNFGVALYLTVLFRARRKS